jgi:hypothetical protein
MLVVETQAIGRAESCVQVHEAGVMVPSELGREVQRHRRAANSPTDPRDDDDQAVPRGAPRYIVDEGSGASRVEPDPVALDIRTQNHNICGGRTLVVEGNRP